MSPLQIVIWLVIGIIMGWLARVLVKRRGFGLTGDVIIGIIGAFLGNLIIGENIAKGSAGYAFDSLIGAFVLLLIFKIIRKSR
ncbi:GlsB/YeaQ/YmgE family stress response membrane protein [Candidatus Aminicenantes bacterium AC-335-B20]|jgi:uncharacterized membrane protein YeaQ/YmgE (transglycosylase-associated protein family)|nr:GlsB/YeaQ/YmgE family stress response membrane protein [SCandidatus Aminicenantes bacterium Aminicenantia_JdfR_composite]MCP2597033.1 GlsB/YeaQ/YmgE family stress response membrane protein [Candidatus Aminicenantes bacterium AC-335-G13]MCP2599202.1 GlsB/YeaQ/YmgE family stress response membrane protein [Candidatus Aminicenantes bacterium AC-335-B20]MCP2618954.1 GlsB/YeaQ/YmgE family stress response membrane protein [Candidatus Aminicenantes bacterium AC-335-A11]MCP2619354.1 GlsB/YeaQ/YmgE fa